MDAIPHIFISATTADLARVRDHLTRLVLKHGCHPVVEEGFDAVPHDVALAQYLNLKLRRCSGMIHVAGLAYGGEAPGRSTRAPRRSWTQMEYHQAKRQSLDIMVCLAKPGFYRSRMPREQGNASERKVKSALQADHCGTLRKGKGFYYEFKKAADLTANVGTFLARFRKSLPPVKTKVLFVGAELGTGFDLTGQLRRIRKAVSSPGMKGHIEIAGIFNPTAAEIIGAINREQPSIVHVAGRQEQGTIMLHNESKTLVPFDATKLADALARTRNKALRLVILDTCYSMQQAKRLTSRGVPYAIGIYDAIADDVATDYYAAFYNQIASGHDLGSALKTAGFLCEGSLADPKKKRALETRVLGMPFNPTLHIPSLASSSGLDASLENFA